MATATSDATLARGAIGLREVLFQSITHMAPAAAVAFSIPAGIGFGGGATPLAVIFAIVACLLVAISIGQLAKHLPSAGSFYTYASKGLHPSVGFLVAWAYAFVEPLIAPLLVLILGITVSGTLHTEFGWSADLWWPWAIAGSILVFVLGYFGIRLSARTGTLLGLFEIGVFLALALWLIAKAGSHNTLAVFTTKFANNPDFKGLSGVVAASVFTILAFIGFEAAAPLAEETADPRRKIGQAVVYSCLGIGLFYVLTSYAASVFYGPVKMVGIVAAGNGDPWENILARQAWGAGWVMVFLAIVNSAIANANAGSNAATRTYFSMGRIRLAPAIFARVHPRWKSPHVAVVGQLVVSLGVSLWLGFQYGPLTAFLLVATIITVVFIPIYIVVNLSCLAYYWRYQRSEFNWLLHGAIPVLGMLAFVPAFFAGAGLPVFRFIGRLPKPLSYAGLVAGIWMVLGVIYLIYLWSKDRQRIQDTGRVFLEEESATAAPA
ncbi:MAG TPA: amino acid permease [Actinobacteria bacterium]|jgi:amino acid transporter|nr:amino acid permease [Actinomycetota bacterium]